MLVDLLIVAVTISLLTLLTAGKHKWLSQLKENSLPSGLLLTILKLLIFISRLDSPDSGISDFYMLLLSVLVKFRPLLIGLLFRIIFGIVEAVLNKDKSEGDDKSDTKDKSRKFDFSLLSRREIEVARLAAKGYTNAQIAECLYISAETVKSHMNSILEKLHISSRKELMEN